MKIPKSSTWDGHGHGYKKNYRHNQVFKQQKLTNKNGQPAPNNLRQLKRKHKKLKHSYQQTIFNVMEYLLVDTRVFNDIIETVGSCPDCSSKVNLVHNMEAKNILAHLLELSCLECDWTKSFWTSKKIEKNIDGCKTRGKSGFDVNTGCVIATREIGKGYTALKHCVGI